VLHRSSYKAFGQMTRTADAQGLVQTRLGYTGREASVGGSLYYRTRHYDPSLGRFLQRDHVEGNALVPPSLHRYTYVHNNPVRYVDPTGESVSLSEGFRLALRVFRKFFFMPVFQRTISHKWSAGFFTLGVIAGAILCAFADNPVQVGLSFAAAGIALMAILLVTLAMIFAGRVMANPHNVMRANMVALMFVGMGVGCMLVAIYRSQSNDEFAVLDLIWALTGDIESSAF
jgi:RHS repeat-associated protein